MMINGAIIGAGKIAETGHFPAYLSEQMKFKLNITAIVDQSSERLEKAKKYFPNANLYSTIDELLSKEKIDFVDICTPPHIHKEIIAKCASENIHILCEKPLSNFIDDSSYIEQIVNSGNIVFVPCHQYKYAMIWKFFNKMAHNISDSKLYLQFDVIRLKADSSFDTNNPDWRVNSGISGGGISVDTGVHYFYLILNMLGLPKNIFANLLTLKHHQYGVEDSAFVQVEFEKGLAQINLTWAGNKRYNSAMLVSSEAGLFYNGKELKLTDKDGEIIIPAPDMSDKSVYVSLYIELLTEFYNRIINKNYSLDLLEESINTMKILDYAKKSNELKSTVEFN